MYIDSPEKVAKKHPRERPISRNASLAEVTRFAEVAKWQTH